MDSNVAKDAATATKEAPLEEEALTKEEVATREALPTKQEDLLEATEVGEATTEASCLEDLSRRGKKRSSSRGTTTSTRPMNSSRRFSQNFQRLKLRIPSTTSLS